ncbi:MAG: hypothetical protein ACF8AM_22710, partial [Rhodopirellula sp. JB055]|uniref:hypothetical protein n=1 Tax=Rhodopirellula sp. JB055 TaxID=3342846 RepID=UPI00370CE82B
MSEHGHLKSSRQYKKTRLPKDPETNKPEPLLTFKRGALVHFAVSQYEAAMTTRLDGANTKFLPFNRGTHDGGAGNDVPPGDGGCLAISSSHTEVLEAYKAKLKKLQKKYDDPWIMKWD